MSYRKFSADHLFTGIEWLENEHVLVTNEQGAISGIIPAHEAGEGIEVFPGILTPGFVNGHCHLELSHMKGLIPEKTGMIDFLTTVIRQRNFDAGAIQQAIAAAETGMLQNGIVAVGDICNTADTIAQKKQGRLYYHNFIEAIGFADATASQRFDAAVQVYDQFARLYRVPAESNSIVPHAPYSVSGRLFQLITHFPGNQLLTMHNQESMAENEFMVQGSGDFHRLFKALNIDISQHVPGKKRSLPACLPWFLPQQSVILVHNTTTGEEDLQFIAHCQLPIANLVFCLCPNANLYIGNPLPDIDLFRKYGANIIIGTDSLASNRQLNILAELHTIHRHFPHIEKKELLQWATLNGARALGVDGMLGSFEEGKTPGVLVVDEALNTVKRIL